MDNYLAFAISLARQGGKMIKDNFGQPHDIEVKSDKSPVTQTDKAINDMIIEAITASYPDHGLLGEEADYGDGGEEYQWICDPLDGTKPFILGMPHSTCIIGLSKAGKILLGVVYDPFTDELYHAVQDGGAFCNDQPIKVSSTSFTTGFVLTETSTTPYVAPLIASGALLEPVGGAGYMAIRLADGRASAIFKGRYDFHDIGPASLIVTEAGGKVTDGLGDEILFNYQTDGIIILSNGVDHDKLVAIAQTF